MEHTKLLLRIGALIIISSMWIGAETGRIEVAIIASVIGLVLILVALTFID